MRRMGAKPWIAGWMLLAGLFAAGCAEDKSGTVAEGEPFLQVRVNSSCDQNTLPVTTPTELQEKTMERAQVVVTGGDPTRPSGELASGTQVFIYVGKDGKPGGDGGSFMSTLGGDSLTGEPMTADMAFSPPALTDEFFCTKVGVHLLYAGVKKYDPTGSAIIMPVGDGFPVRCMDHDQWMCDCNSQCGPQDAAVPDAALPDAALPDLAIPDAIATDAAIDAVIDMDQPPSVWRLDFAAPVEAEEFQLQVRGAAMAGARTDVVLQYKITENGTPRGGVRVEFSKIEPAIGDVRVNPLFGFTNAEGLVSTLVQAGDTPGQVRVLATAFLPADGQGDDETIDEPSPPISISSGLPSLTNFAFGCVEDSFTGFASRAYDPATTPPDGDRWFVGIHDGTPCPFALADRLGNRIPAGTPVRFMTEAGSVNDVVRTNEEGRGETTMLVTSPHPKDVDPFDYETALTKVTAVMDRNGQQVLTYNPRDGLVRIVGSTRGEEGFRDVDGDHQYTDGVDIFGPGDDVGEPFVDLDDNNVWDEGEEFDDVDSDGQYTPPNGVWDSNTVIWRSTVVLWTGHFAPDESYFGPTPCDRATDGRECSEGGCFGPECSPDHPIGRCANSLTEFSFASGGRFKLTLQALDQNGNCLESRRQGTITVTATTAVPGYGVPVFAESQQASVTIPIGDVGCGFGVPEEPGGSTTSVHLVAANVMPGDDNAPRSADGQLKFDVAFQNGLGELVTETFFRTYCVELVEPVVP